MMYYEFENSFYTEDEIDDVLYEYAEENIDEFIDEGEEVRIFNMMYSPSEVLKKVDPIAYFFIYIYYYCIYTYYIHIRPYSNTNTLI